MNPNKVTAFTFDASQVAPQTAFEALPGGWYPMVIADGDVTLTEGGAGQRLNLEFQVYEGPLKGRRAFDGFNTRHSNADTQRISQAQLSGICHAIKVYQFTDISALFGKPFLGLLSVDPKRTVNADGKEKDEAGNLFVEGTPGTKTYDAKNRFKGAKEYTPGTAAGATPAGASPAAGGVPAWAVPGAPAAGATPTPAIVPPPVAAAGKPAAKPAGKPAAAKPAGKPAPKAPERKFFVGIDAPEFAELVSESKLVEYLTKGLPADTGILSEADSLAGVTDYKTAAAYQVGATPAPVATQAQTPPPPAAAATPAGGTVPPWLR